MISTSSARPCTTAGRRKFFEGGAAAFAKDADRQITQLKRRLAEAQEQLSRKNEVLAEVMEEYVRCKKNGGDR